LAQALEIDFAQGFREDVRSVIFRGDTGNSDIACQNLFADEVILDADVLGVRVPDVVFC